MTALNKYINEFNGWEAKHFKQPELVRPTNAEECEPFFQRLECQLSPENISCDGEASIAFVRNRSKQLHSVWRALEKIRKSTRDMNI